MPVFSWFNKIFQLHKYHHLLVLLQIMKRQQETTLPVTYPRFSLTPFQTK